MSFRRSKATEESNTKHCPKQSKGSAKHKDILRIAQDDSLLYVRFLTAFEMTQRAVRGSK
jgi:hypothetical protein